MTSESPSDLGESMHRLATRLFPFHRSISGEGARDTFAELARHIPLQVTEVPTGTAVFDWTVPREWRIRDAYIADQDGLRIVDYRQSNLHVVNHSLPIHARLDWEQLRPHLHTDEHSPHTIPYRTGYFRDIWGFCVTAQQYESLRGGGPWEVVIDAEFLDGSLTLAECELSGTSSESVVLHCHTCHPSLANDNLSGIVVATELAKRLQLREHYYTYRFVFVPATIGAISWLALRSAEELRQIRHGLVLTLLGDGAPFTFKQTRNEESTLNRLVPLVLAANNFPCRVERFEPIGYDETQYASPGLNLPVGRLSRSTHGRFPEYHTSADNLQFIQPANLAESLRACEVIIEGLENNIFPISNCPSGEPQLGRRGLYRAFGERDDRGELQPAIMWLLNLADGMHDLVAIAERSGISFEVIVQAAEMLISHQLITPARQRTPMRDGPGVWPQ